MGRPQEKIDDLSMHSTIQSEKGSAAIPLKQNRFLKMMQGPHAMWATIIVAFCESSFFPIPPDIGIASIVLQDRKKAWLMAFGCTIASVLGGFLGYYLGATLFDSIGQKIIELYGLSEKFSSLKTDFQHYGFWIICFKGLTPIPYKLLTISSGLFELPFWQFTVASIIARSTRFFLLSWGLWYLGPLAKPYFEKFFGWVIALVVAIIIAGFILIKFLL